MTTTISSCRGKAARDRPRWPAIAIIGGYPPPYGGITVHIQRLVDRLEADGADFVLYNTLSTIRRDRVVPVLTRYRKLLYVPWLLGFGFRHRCRVVHMHSTNWPAQLLFCLIARLRAGKYVLSIQGRRGLFAYLQRRRGIIGRIWRWAIRQLDVVVACNPHIGRVLVEEIGLPAERVLTAAAFIPPDPAKSSELPEYVQAFAERHTPLLSAVGWIGGLYQGRDTYGLDMMLELVERLRKDYPNVGLVMSINGGEERAVQEAVKDCRRRLGDSVLLVVEELQDISRMIQASDLFLRPTNTDGDAVSVREALYLGVPVVASDIVPRPDPTVIFRTRDMEDFEAKVRQALAGLEALKTEVASHPMADNGKTLSELYARLAGTK